MDEKERGRLKLKFQLQPGLIIFALLGLMGDDQKEVAGEVEKMFRPYYLPVLAIVTLIYAIITFFWK